MRTYKDIIFDVANSCKEVFYNGYRDNYSDVIKAATDIYIAELRELSFDNCIREVEMIRQNFEAAIEAKEKEISKNRDDILKLDKVLDSIKEQQKKLLEKDTDLCYELEELKEQL